MPSTPSNARSVSPDISLAIPDLFPAILMYSAYGKMKIQIALSNLANTSIVYVTTYRLPLCRIHLRTLVFSQKVMVDNVQGGTTNCWKDFFNQPVEPGMSWYYLVQCAYNMDTLLSLVELSFCVEWVNPFSYSAALEYERRERAHSDEILSMMKRGQLFLWTPILQI